MKIGAQYYTIRDFCKTLEDFDLSCKKVADMGYKYIQLSGIGDFSAKDIKPIVDKYSLSVVCTHRPPQKYLEDIEGEISYHKTLGCKICGIGSMPGFNAEAETVEKFVNDFTPVAKRLKEEGLVLAYHNHAFEFQKLGGKFVFDLLTEKMTGTDFKYILDVYWLAVAGLNPARFIRERGESVACVHLKDLRIKENQAVFSEVGMGNLDWQDIMSACEEAKIPYGLVEQDTCERDPFMCLCDSYDFLAKNFPEVTA